MAGRFSNLFKGFFESEKVAGLLLLLCTIISLVLANSAIGEGYIHLMHTHLDLSVAGIELNHTVEEWVNDGLMSIFFLLVGLEVERQLYAGELKEFKKAVLPLAAALGGICIPSLIHFMLNSGTPSQPGFAIPMATDIAFALGILSLAGNRVPVSVKVFLTALAIIDDIGAIIVIAIFYTDTVYFINLFIALGIFAALCVLNRLRVRHLVFYLLPGVFMWYFFLKSGVHATLAGVLLAFAVPFHDDDEHNISYHLQHFLHKPVAFIIVPIFALVNTAIPLQGSLLSTINNPNSLGIILGLAAGKLLGIFSFPFLLVKAGWAKLQEGITWKLLAGIGFLGGIGFTMSMFIGNLAFDDPELIRSSKISILIGSAISAVAGLTIFFTNKPPSPETTNVS